MIIKKTPPRILIVTPEVTYLPDDMGNMSDYSAKAGGLADVSAALISALFDLGCDVHVALPDYRSINGSLPDFFNKELDRIKARLEDERIHLAQDRAFYYLTHVYSGSSDTNIKISLAFQREVVNNIIPRVNPGMSVNHFSEGLSHRAFAGADFLFMPSRFEPCGLPQMTGCIYGTLPIVYNTEGDSTIQFSPLMSTTTGATVLFLTTMIQTALPGPLTRPWTFTVSMGMLKKTRHHLAMESFSTQAE